MWGLRANVETLSFSLVLLKLFRKLQLFRIVLIFLLRQDYLNYLLISASGL